MLRLSWGYVRSSWAYVSPYCAHLGAMFAYVGASWGYVGGSCAILALKHMLNVTGPKKIVNYRGFCRHAYPTARLGAGAQLCWPICWPMLAYLAGNVGLAWSYVDPTWGYVGLSWRLCGPILRPLSTDLEAYVGPCWPVRNQKIRKMGRAKKHYKTQDILRVGGLSWGAILEHLGSMLADLGGYIVSAWGYVGPFWNYVGPFWDYVGPFWRLYWPILGLCSPFLTPILVHVDPSWATSSEKGEKMRRTQNTVKRDCFWRPGVSAAGGPFLLRRGEKRLRQGAPGRI